MKKPIPPKSTSSKYKEMQSPFNDMNNDINNINNSSQQKIVKNIKIEYYQTENQKSQLDQSDFIRTSSESIPNNEYLIRNTGIPFGINLTPFPDIDSSLISQYSFGGGNSFIPRCQKCKSFYNPFCEIDNNYTSYKCNICFNTNSMNNIDIDTIKKIENKNEEIYEIFIIYYISQSFDKYFKTT